MAGLLNTLQDSIDAKKQATKSNLEQIKELAVAKLGKVYEGQQGTATSRQAEKRAISVSAENINNLTSAVSKKQTEQQQQFEAAQAESRLAAKQMDNQALSLRENLAQQKSQLYSRAAQNASKLSLQERKYVTEQVIFMEKLSNDKYLMELNNVWAKQNLNDELNFNEQLNRMVFGDNYDLLQDNLTFKTMLNADERTFKMEMANMNNALAEELLGIQSQGAKEAGMISGVSKIATEGIKYYAGSPLSTSDQTEGLQYGNYVDQDRDTGMTGNYEWGDVTPTFGNNEEDVVIPYK